MLYHNYMAKIEIPIEDTLFEKVSTDKAVNLIKVYLYTGSVTNGYDDNINVIKSKFEENFNQLASIGDKLLFSKIVLLHLAKEKEKGIRSWQHQLLKDKLTVVLRQNEAEEENQKFEDLQYFIHKLLSKEKVYLNSDAFTIDEVESIHSKIDDIINSLTEIKAGQEVIFNEFELVKSGIKSDVESLKPEVVLGRNKFFKLVLGSIGSYTGNKVADEIFAQLRPSIISLLDTQGTHLLNQFNKLLS